MNVSFKDVLSSYNDNGEDVVGEFGRWTSDRFDLMKRSDRATPVLITALDEEDDLTTALLSLARQSSPVRPVIVDNGCIDRTSEFAKAMGADIVSEPAQTKIRALITGLGYISANYEPGNILLTDADTAFGTKWAEIMNLNMGHPDADIAVQIGSALYHNIGTEGNIAVDILRSIRSIFQASRFPDRTSGRGHNMGLWFQTDDVETRLIKSLSPEHITRNDTHLAEQVVALGGVKRGCLDPRATAFTRGDRMPDLPTFTRALLSRQFRIIDSYKDWYERADSIELEGSEDYATEPANY